MDYPSLPSFASTESMLSQSSRGLFSERMSQARCLCEIEKRMNVFESQITKLKSFHGRTKEVASIGDYFISSSVPQMCEKET